MVRHEQALQGYDALGEPSFKIGVEIIGGSCKATQLRRYDGRR